MVVAGEFLPAGLGLIALGTLMGWLAMNQFGFFQNGRMRRRLERILKERADLPPSDRVFVGFASPRYAGMLDAHEDVGFFFLLPDRAVFVSETRRVELLKAQCVRVGYRANVHTLVGLGRWVSIDGLSDGKTVRMMIEPRERNTMLANLRRSKPLMMKVRRWLRDL